MSIGETIPVPSEGVRDRAPFTLPQFGIFAQGTHAHLAFGAGLWRGVAPEKCPDDLGPFQPEIGKDDRGAPAAQRDAWLWISGAASRRDDRVPVGATC